VATTVEIESGVLRGLAADERGVRAFLGIPYGLPPLGDLRWSAPRPAARWSGVRDAVAAGPCCPSVILGGPPRPDSPSSEDCLTLNIWTAAHATDAGRPVMVWVHGGGFQFGAGLEPNTDGARLAALGVVVVSFNYRLGILGFLAHPDLDREGPSGNYGLLDQIAALEWVRANIASFGGDPDNVTLFGESAGAHAVGLLMTSPQARGLFHRAILESGALWDGDTGSLQTRAESRARGTEVVAKLGEGSIATMRALPVDALVIQTGWHVRDDPVSAAFSPGIDGHVLAESPAAAFAESRAAPVPLLAGWNGAEGYIFRDRMPADPAALIRAIETRFGSDRLEQALRDYPVDDGETAARSAQRLIGNLVIAEQVWEVIRAHGSAGGPATFAYSFDYRSPYLPVPAHTTEIDFVFGSLRPQHLIPGAGAPGDGDRRLSDLIMAYWTNFARTGDPNAPGLPAWPRYSPPAPWAMTFRADKTEAAPENSVGMSLIAACRAAGRLPERWRAVAPQPTG
jgi:para-nitrobenzyl esterase